MTDNSQQFDKLQERNEQVIKNISQLQQQEKKLYAKLDDVNLSSEEKKQIIMRINEISQMRMNIYSGLNDMYSMYHKNVTSSSNTLEQSIAAIDILENELNESKIRLNLLEDQKNNKLRLVQINTYYGKRYNTHSTLMKTIIFVCIPVIILSILANRGFLPPKLYVFLSGLIIIIGLVIIGLQLIDISNRDNMNWDEYNWRFDRESAPTAADSADNSSSSNPSSSNPWSIPSLTCIGSACCYDGSTYDDTKNICVPNGMYNTNNPQSSGVETFKGLDKYGYTQDKTFY
jgi:hypothetical protein